MPIYEIKPVAEPKSRLVRATHPAHALRHVAQKAYEVSSPTSERMYELGRAGVELETAGEESSEGQKSLNLPPIEPAAA